MHLYDPGTLIHLALIPQALVRPHSLISMHSWSADPVNPVGQEHVKLPFVLTHSAFDAHGELRHSLISVKLLML